MRTKAGKMISKEERKRKHQKGKKKNQERKETELWFNPDRWYWSRFPNPPPTHTHSLFAFLVVHGFGVCFGRLQLFLGCRKLILFRIDLQERGNKVPGSLVEEKCEGEGVKKKKKKHSGLRANPQNAALLWPAGSAWTSQRFWVAPSGGCTGSPRHG